MAVDYSSAAVSDIKGQPHGRKTYGSVVSVPKHLAALQNLGSFFIYLHTHFSLKWRVFLCPWQENVSRKHRRSPSYPFLHLLTGLAEKFHRKSRGEFPSGRESWFSLPPSQHRHLFFPPTVALILPVWQRDRE